MKPMPYQVLGWQSWGKVVEAYIHPGFAVAELCIGSLRLGKVVQVLQPRLSKEFERVLKKDEVKIDGKGTNAHLNSNGSYLGFVPVELSDLVAFRSCNIVQPAMPVQAVTKAFILKTPDDDDKMV